MHEEHIGFIGLGAMGKPMAGHLVGKGYRVTVHSRSQGPVDALVAAGARAAPTPAEVARQSTIVITMLPDTPDVDLALTLGPDQQVEAFHGIPSFSAASIWGHATSDCAGTLPSSGAFFPGHESTIEKDMKTKPISSIVSVVHLPGPSSIKSSSIEHVIGGRYRKPRTVSCHMPKDLAGHR
jgi:hypothetical protein